MEQDARKQEKKQKAKGKMQEQAIQVAGSKKQRSKALESKRQDDTT